jgi:hypothetical protein
MYLWIQIIKGFNMSPQDQYNKFLEYWKDKVVNPEHYPKIFEYQVKFWEYYEKNKSK